MNAVDKIRQAGFTLTLSGESLSIKPRKRLSRTQTQYIKDNKADIVKQLKTEKLSGWLEAIGETCQELIAEFWEQVSTDKEAEAYFLGRADKYF
jgi:hypothetical protein